MSNGHIPDATRAEVVRLLTETSMSSYQIREATGVSQSQILRIRHKLGLPPLSFRKERPVPEDFAAMFAELRTLRKLLKHYRASVETLDQWITATGLERPKNRAEMKVPLPSGWFDLTPKMTLEDIQHRFGLTKKVAQRMVRETGVRPLPYRNPEAVVYRMGRPVINPVGDTYNKADRAAHYLRRFYPSVHKADIRIRENGFTTWGSERGLPNLGRGYYHVAGVGVVPLPAMMELASAKGWSEQA